MKNILVTAVGGDVACAALRCIKNSKYKDVMIYGCDISTYIQGTDYIDKFLKVAPFSDEKLYMTNIKSICKEYGIDYILPITEAEIAIFNRHLKYFDKENIKLIINKQEIIEVCLDKYKTAYFLKKNNIDVPDTYMLKEYYNQCQFPIILKPNKGCGGIKNLIIKNNKEFECFLNSSEINYYKENYIVQKYIGTESEEYTVGVFSNGISTKTIILKRKLSAAGFSNYVETCIDPVIENIMDKIAKAFNLKGSINVQLRKDGNKYLIFEINPRISSTVAFRDKFGFKDLIWWIDLLDTGDCNFKYEAKAGFIGIKTLNEKVFMNI